MSKETVKLEESSLKEVSKVSETRDAPKKLTREELKEKFRKVAMGYSGRLTIDDKYKKPGKVLRIDNDDLATRKYLSELGYTPVTDHVEVGSGGLHQSHNMGSEIHIEQGITFSQPGILYECDQEVFEVRMELEAEMNNEQLQSMIESNQRADQKLVQ